jgi:hypothetical protein
MFPLFHDRTRRLLCRSLFLLFGVLPTTAVLAWSVVLNGEGYHTAICEKLSLQLGGEVRVRSVSHPRQEMTLLEGFELVNPETAEVLLSSQQVKIREEEHLTVITANHSELKLNSRNWWQPIIERRLRLGSKKQLPIRLQASEVALSWPEGKQALRDCRIEFTPSDQANTAHVTFQIGTESSTEPVQLQLRRTNPSGQPVSSFELKTGSSHLPCSLLAVLTEQNNPFGAASIFQGILQGGDGLHGWNVEVTEGLIRQVDLNSLARQYFPGQCTGIAEIQLRRAFVHRGQTEEIEGVIAAGPGKADRTMLEAVAGSLQLRPTASNTTAVELFDQMAAKFDLNSTGLTILGRCDAAQSGVVLRSSNAPILLQPAGSLTYWWRGELLAPTER